MKCPDCDMGLIAVPCSYCDGSGREGRDNCPICEGSATESGVCERCGGSGIVDKAWIVETKDIIQKIINRLYAAYGTDSGILFGIKNQRVVAGIVNIAIMWFIEETEKGEKYESKEAPAVGN